MTTRLETGYFATPGKTPSKVHIVFKDERELLCGRRITDRKAIYHFCATGVYEPYLTCEVCRAMIHSKRFKERRL